MACLFFISKSPNAFTRSTNCIPNSCTHTLNRSYIEREHIRQHFLSLTLLPVRLLTIKNQALLIYTIQQKDFSQIFKKYSKKFSICTQTLAEILLLFIVIINFVIVIKRYLIMWLLFFKNKILNIIFIIIYNFHSPRKYISYYF